MRGRQLGVRVFGEGYFLQLEFVIFFGSEVPDSQRGVLIEVGHAGAVQRKEILRITLKIGRVLFEGKGSFVVEVEDEDLGGREQRDELVVHFQGQDRLGKREETTWDGLELVVHELDLLEAVLEEDYELVVLERLAQ